jgi:hypothetical protein
MEKKNKAAQIYGYVVCVVAVITFIIAIAALSSSLIDLGDPLHSQYQNKTNLASFENYKVEAMKDIKQDAAYIPDDVTLKSMYEAERDSVIAQAKHHTKRNIMTNVILVIVSVLLFIVHWRWMNRLNRLPEPKS